VALLLCFLLAGADSFPQSAQKKPKSPLSSGIDSAAAGQTGGAKSSGLADDGEFLRRVMLDLVGYPPSLEQVKAFMADTNVDKRSERIDQLLDSEEWSDRTARLFCEGWFGDYHKVPIMIGTKLDAGTEQRVVNDFVAWMKLKLGKDAPYREIVEAIIRARGTGTGDPALLWKLSCFSGGDDGPAIEFANRVSRHFLGIRLRCAQCHDHPFDIWKEKHFYSMAAFFGRTKVKAGADVEVSEDGSVDSYKTPMGNNQPMFIYGQKPGKTDQWMDALSVYVAGPENPQLAPATVNRVWSWLFGRGLVHPVDDFNKMTQATAGPILGVLAKEFRSSKYSIKGLYRGICNSDTYQRSSENEARMMRPNYAVGWIKHLDAEQLQNSIQVATGNRPSKDALTAIAMVSPLFPADVVWCEVTPLPGNMRQALFVRNNHTIQGQISSGLAKLGGSTPAEKVADMFLAVLSRKPNQAETDRFVKYINGHQGQGMEDAYWTLMNTTEFLSRH
jgi:hypothetical protein